MYVLLSGKGRIGRICSGLPFPYLQENKKGDYHAKNECGSKKTKQKQKTNQDRKNRHRTMGYGLYAVCYGAHDRICSGAGGSDTAPWKPEIHRNRGHWGGGRDYPCKECHGICPGIPAAGFIHYELGIERRGSGHHDGRDIHRSFLPRFLEVK